MPTKNPRINITLEEATASLLADLASQNQVSVASLAKELILEALDRREDLALSTIAELREKCKAPRIAHKDAWK